MFMFKSCLLMHSKHWALKAKIKLLDLVVLKHKFNRTPKLVALLDSKFYYVATQNTFP